MEIEKLLSVIDRRNGLSLSNRFRVTFFAPGSSLPAEEVSILCDSVTLPGITLTSKDYRTVKNLFKVPAGYSFTDVTMTFLNTSDYSIRKMFDTWRKLVVDPDSYRIGYESEYTTDIRIAALDIQDKEIYAVTLLKAWPLSLSDISFSNDGSNVVKQEVSFAYRDVL